VTENPRESGAHHYVLFRIQYGGILPGPPVHFKFVLNEKILVGIDWFEV
jgi:hypothetical protein